MLKDSRSYEVQIIDAVRSVNRALGGTYGTSSAIGKTEFNQYEVQLIDAIKGIGRTLSGKGLSLAGGAGIGDLSGYATAAQFQDLSRRVTILENESFFRLVDGNVTLKEQYQNLWVPGWLAAGGIGTGGGGGGVSSLCELDDVYHTSGSGVLRADGTDAVPGDSLVYNTTLGWVAAPVSGGGGSGTVTGVKMNGTTLSPSTTGIVDLGTVITSLSGYATEQWVGQQGFLTSFTETDPTVPAWAKASSKPSYAFSELTAHPTTLSGYGITDAKIANGVITLGNDTITPLTAHQTIYKLTLNAGTFTAGEYTPNSGATTFNIPTSLDHIADGATRKLSDYLPLSGGTMTGDIIMNGGSVLSATDSANYVGSPTNRFGNGFFRNLYTTYFGFRDGSDGSIQWGNIGMGDGYTNIYMQAADGTPYGQYVFNAVYGFFHGGNGNVPCGRSDHRWSELWAVDADLSGDLSLASTSHIDIGPLRIEYDATNKALHITKKDGNDTNTYGLYADGFVAAGGTGQTS